MSNKLTRSSVTLKKVGKPFFLNFMTIEDEEWVAERFPDGILAELERINVDAVLDLFWRLLDNDAKRIVRDAKMFEWEGLVEKEITFSDPILKLKQMVGGGKDQEMTEILNAIFATEIKSAPDIVATQKKKTRVDGL